jgi:hypothetical protein
MGSTYVCDVQYASVYTGTARLRPFVRKKKLVRPGDGGYAGNQY